MSDVVALVSSVVLWTGFVFFSSLLAFDLGGAPWAEREARFLSRHRIRTQVGWERAWRMLVSITLLTLIQVAAISAIAQNLGRVTWSEAAILGAEPVLAAAWTVHLVRRMIRFRTRG